MTTGARFTQWAKTRPRNFSGLPRTQIINRTASAIGVLMLSTAIQPDVVEYVDTGRILAHDAKGEYIMFAKPGPASDYWEGEG